MRGAEFKRKMSERARWLEMVLFEVERGAEARSQWRAGEDGGEGGVDVC